jgi:hypothetical protein
MANTGNKKLAPKKKKTLNIKKGDVRKLTRAELEKVAGGTVFGPWTNPSVAETQ